MADTRKRLMGWQEEVTEGTSPIVAGTAVTTFGFVGNEKEWQHPEYNQEIKPIHKMGYNFPLGKTRGPRQVKIPLTFPVQHAWEWKYVLGTVTDEGGGVYSFTPCDPGDLPSRTFWSKQYKFVADSDDYKEAVGMKTRRLTFKAFESMAYVFDAEYIGLNVASGTTITADPQVANPTNENYSGPKTWDMQTKLEFNDVSLPNVVSIEIDVVNNLTPVSGGLSSATPRKILQGEGGAVIVAFGCVFDGTTNDILSKLHDALTDASTKDLEYRYTWNTSYYHDIQVHNLNFKDPIIKSFPNGLTTYSCVGVAHYDLTNDIIKVQAKDGITYS